MNPSVHRSSVEVVFQSLGLLVLCLGSIFVCGSICFVIYKEQKLRTITNVFILNLAIANIVIAIFILPFLITITITGHWVFGHAWCIICGFLLQLFTTASIFSICAISVQRFYMMTRAMSVKITSGIARRIVGLVWFESLVLSTPPLFGWSSYRYSSGKSFCSVYWLGSGPDMIFLLFYFLSAFVLPLVIISYASWRIHKVTKRHKVRMTPMMTEMNSSCASIQSSMTSPLETLDIKRLDSNSSALSYGNYGNGSVAHAQPTGSLRTFGAKSGFNCTSTPVSKSNKLAVPERTIRAKSWPSSQESSLSTLPGSDFYSGSKIRHSFNSYKKYLKPSDSPSTSLCRRIQEAVLPNAPRRDRSSMFEIRATKSLVLGLSTFLLCFAPYFLCNMFSTFLHKKLPPGLEWFLVWLFFSNTVVSTVLYGFFNSRIRHALRKFPLFEMIFKDSRKSRRHRSRHVRWQLDS